MKSFVVEQIPNVPPFKIDWDVDEWDGKRVIEKRRYVMRELSVYLEAYLWLWKHF